MTNPRPTLEDLGLEPRPGETYPEWSARFDAAADPGQPQPGGARPCMTTTPPTLPAAISGTLRRRSPSPERRRPAALRAIFNGGLVDG